MEEQKLNKTLEKDDLESESSNDNHTEEPTEQKPEVFENSENFCYEDGKGRKILLGSAIFHVAQLADIARQFLGLPIPEKPSTKTPGYTG